MVTFQFTSRRTQRFVEKDKKRSGALDFCANNLPGTWKTILLKGGKALLKLTPKEQKLVLLLGCLLILGFVLRFVLPEQESLQITRGSEEVEEAPSLSGNLHGEETGQGNFSSEATKTKTIEVHVAGAVARAGVYLLEEGSRVYQAVEKAGGALEDADLERVNLAQPLYDGQQIIIPRQLQGGASGDETGLNPSESGSSQSGKININLATQSQLETLPGIGSVKARGIIKYREENGYFSSIEDLLKVSGIGEKTLEGIRELITIY